MASVLSEAILEKCDRLIERHRLHCGGLIAPVATQALLEAYGEIYKYGSLPSGVDGLVMRWTRGGEQFVVMMLDERLCEAEASAQRRYVIAHEMAHVLLGHPGADLELRKMRKGGWAVQSTFGEWVELAHERQCGHVAAYLLVPLPALMEMEEMESWHVARVLDVPEELVGIRGEIWRKWGR